MRFFDVDTPFAVRRPASRLIDVDLALADNLDGDSISRESSISTVRRHEAPAVQAPAHYIETTSIMTTSSTARQSSSDSSSLSSETLYTDFGLHRALNSLTISQTHVHAASQKARKNLRYLHDMRATHDQARNELDSAIDAYQDVFNIRDANDDPKLEGTLNRQFLSANNRLSRASREYKAYIDDLNELRHLPKVSRAFLQSAYTDRKSASKLDRQDEQHVSMRAKLRQRQQQAQELDKVRHGLIVATNPISGLTEHIKVLEHERDNLKEERNRLRVERNNLQAEQQDLQTKRQSLQNDVSFKTEWAMDLDRLLKDAVAKSLSLELEVKSYKSQLSFAKAETTRYKDENKALRREIQDLNYNLAGAQDEMDNMRDANEDLRRNNAHLRREFDEVHGQARTLQRRYSDVTSSGRSRRSVMEPVPYGGSGGGVRAAAASIQEMLDEESQMREASMGEKAMSL